MRDLVMRTELWDRQRANIASRYNYFNMTMSNKKALATLAPYTNELNIF